MNKLEKKISLLSRRIAQLELSLKISGIPLVPYICKDDGKIEQIQKIAAKVCGLESAKMLSGPRKPRERVNQSVSWARQLGMFASSFEYPSNNPFVASRFGCKSHSSVNHAHRIVKNYFESDETCRKQYREYREMLSTLGILIPEDPRKDDSNEEAHQ